MFGLRRPRTSPTSASSASNGLARPTTGSLRVPGSSSLSRPPTTTTNPSATAPRSSTARSSTSSTSTAPGAPSSRRLPTPTSPRSTTTGRSASPMPLSMPAPMAAVGNKLRVGDRVHVPTTGQAGTLRYLGPTHFRPGIWAGIALDIVGSGKNDGSVGGQAYFECPPDTGLFVPADRVVAMPHHPSTPTAAAHQPGTPRTRWSASSSASDSGNGGGQQGSGYLTPPSGMMSPRTAAAAPTTLGTGSISRLSRPSFSHPNGGASPSPLLAPGSTSGLSAGRRTPPPPLALSHAPRTPATPTPSARPTSYHGIPTAPEPMSPSRASKRLTLSHAPPSFDGSHAGGDGPMLSPTLSQTSAHSVVHAGSAYALAHPMPPLPNAAVARSVISAAAPGSPTPSASRRSLAGGANGPVSRRASGTSSFSGGKVGAEGSDLQTKADQLEAENRILKLDLEQARATSAISQLMQGDQVASQVADLEAALRQAQVAHDARVAELQQTNASKLAALESMVSELQTSLAEKNQAIHDQSEQLARMQVELTSKAIMATELDDIAQTISVLETDAQHKQVRASQLDKELQDAKEALAAKEAAVVGLEKDKKRVEADLDRAKVRVEALERDLADKVAWMDEYMKEGEGRVEMVAKLHQDIKAKGDKIQALTVDLDHARADVATAQAAVDDWKQQCEKVKADKVVVEARVASLQQQVAKVQADLAARETELAAKDAELTQLLAKYDALQATVAQRDQRVADLVAVEAEAVALRSQVADLNAVAAARAAQDEERKAAVVQLKADMAALQSQIDVQANEIDTLKRAAEDKERAMAAVERELAAKKQLVAQLQNDVDTLSATCTQNEHALLAATQQAKRLEAQVDAKTKALDAAEAETAAATAALADAERALKEKVKAIDANAQRIAALEADLADATQRAASDSAAAVARAAVQRDLDAANALAQDLDARVAAAAADALAAKAAQTATAAALADAQAELAALQQTHDAATARAAAVADQLATLQTAHAALQAEYRAALDQAAAHDVVTAQLGRVEAKAAQLTQQLADRDARVAELEDEAKAARDRAAEGKAREKQAAADRDALETKVRDLEVALAAKTREAEQWHQKVQHLKAARRETMSHYMESVDLLMSDLTKLQTKYDQEKAGARQAAAAIGDSAAAAAAAEKAEKAARRAQYRQSMPARFSAATDDSGDDAASVASSSTPSSASVHATAANDAVPPPRGSSRQASRNSTSSRRSRSRSRARPVSAMPDLGIAASDDDDRPVSMAGLGDEYARNYPPSLPPLGSLPRSVATSSLGRSARAMSVASSITKDEGPAPAPAADVAASVEE
ncbi:hypothetical protein GGF31_008294 [Allomyces arbusculus]|nr:hypothetical protein GGF31_008294 [Allomyces arbusculus]